MGGGADRACPRNRPSTAAVPVCDGVAVLAARADSGCSPLQRSRSGGSENSAAERCHSVWRASLAVPIWPPVNPSGTSSWPVPTSQAAAKPMPSPRATYVMALAALGSYDEAVAAATGLIDAAEIVRNPYVHSLALLAYGYAFSEADPVRALDAFRRGLVIAQDSGARMIASHLAMSLFRVEAEHGDPFGRARLLHVGSAQLPRLPATPASSASSWLSWPRFLTGVDITSRRRSSPVSLSAQ